jgi:putative transposase
MFKCPYCKKTNSRKDGFRRNKSGLIQKHFCNSCNRSFVNRHGFENMRTRADIVVDALDLRAKGLSYGKIKDFIFQKYNFKVTRSAILYWQNKYGEIINNFTDNFHLSNSINIHADEIFFRGKGQRDKNFIYYWDAIDYDTKFLVADHVSSERNENEAKIFIGKIKQQIVKIPNYIHTDNSFDYPPAIRKVFGRGKIKHIHFPAWRKKFKNNPIERYHNTIKENYKVMRRFKNEVTSHKFLKFFRNYYNFLRPHKTLNWITPAEKAGFGKFNWFSLIKKPNIFGFILNC